PNCRSALEVDCPSRKEQRVKFARRFPRAQPKGPIRRGQPINGRSLARIGGSSRAALGHESIRVVGMIAVPPESVKLGKNQRLRELYQSAKRFVVSRWLRRVFGSTLPAVSAYYMD